MRIRINANISLPIAELSLASFGLIFCILTFTLKNASRDLSANAAITCLGATVAFTFRRAQTELGQAELRKFFSKELVGGRGPLVFPAFKLREDVRFGAASSLDDEPTGLFTKPSYDPRYTFRADIPECVSTNDMQALAKFLGLLQREGAATPPICDDVEGLKNSTFLSFGLSSNNCTHLYTESSGADALFNIVDEKNPSRYREYISVEFNSETKYFRSNERNEIGIFVRHRVRFDFLEPSVWMICAGLGPRGTVGAAHYVCRHWRQLSRKFGNDDFILIFSVPGPIEQTRLIDCFSRAVRQPTDGPDSYERLPENYVAAEQSMQV